MSDVGSPLPGKAQNQTPGSFATALLESIGVSHPSASDIAFVEEWETAEGGNWGNSAHFNPLNTTLKESGSQPFAPGAGVQSYTSWTQGLAATVSTLRSSAYSGVVNALKAGDGAQAEAALKASQWDANHYASGFPTSSAAAAYVKAHGGSGGGGLSLNPITDAKNLLGLGGDAASGLAGDVASGLGSALGPVWTDAKTFGITMAFAFVGLVLVGGGVLSMTKGARQQVTQKTEQAAGTAAKAAAVVAA
jgi:hypothetical protein